MGKFRNGFVREVQEEKKREEEQRRLHEIHGIQDENMLKFLIRTVGRIVRFVATAAIFVLAAVGMLALIYPEVRGELFLVLGTIFEDAQNMIGV